MARQCVFCGDKPITKEHVVPQWVSGVLVPKGTPMQITSVNTLDDKTTHSKRMVNDITEFQVKRVCGPCNHGWMSTLETQAQPLLTRIFNGETTTLTPAHQLLLATWATKTAMVFRYIGERVRDPALEHRRWLFNNNTPSPGNVVWIAAYDGSKVMKCRMREQFLAGRPGDLGDRDNPAIQWVTFHLKHVAFQVLFLTTSYDVKFSMPPEYQRYTTPIWPGLGTDFPWPPPSILDDAKFDTFTNITLT